MCVLYTGDGESARGTDGNAGEKTQNNAASSNASSLPVQLRIRHVIFEKFNDPDLKFTNDEIFGEMRNKYDDMDESCDVCDIESEFDSLCKSGLARNIAQNFNTVWLKLFDVLEEMHCNACSNTIHVAKSEERTCPNPGCGAPLA